MKDYTMFKIADILRKSVYTYAKGLDFMLCKIELLLLEDHKQFDLLI